MSDNIAAALVERAAAQPETLAMIQTRGIARGKPTERRWTYRELNDESDRLARGLARVGITRGMRVVLMVPPTPEFFALTFGLFKLGAVVVLIDPGMGIANLGKCLGEAAPEAFIGVSKAHVARLVLGWSRRTIRHLVTVGWRLWGGWSLNQVRAAGESGVPVLTETTADEMAAILFTSGSTGVAKGVEYTHRLFRAQIAALRDLLKIEPGEIDLPTFPLFGLFGPAFGMTTVLPEMDATRPAQVDPRAIFNAIERYNVNNLFGSPALLRRVAFSREAEDRSLPSLRRVLSAGAPVPAVVLRQMERLLAEGVPIFTPYGATEALPVACIGHREVLDETAGLTTEGKGVCVGKPVPGVEVRILCISDEPMPEWDESLSVPQGTIGEITVRGPMVTARYYRRDEATALHKIRDGDTFWHRMGDVGYLDDEGRIWFCGRKSHRVETSAGTLFTIPCEGVFNAHPAVFRTALVGVPQANGSKVPVLCIELEPEAAREVDRDLVVRQLHDIGAQYEHTRDIRLFLFHPAFPVDVRHNSKIFREKLAMWAAQQLGRS
jgi:acyl-CoA synthetase (AMP-forming)/AMP-acid ligase II